MLLISVPCGTGRSGTTPTTISTAAGSATVGDGRNNVATVSPAHVSYQGSRRSANRGHGTFRGRGGRLQHVWSAPPTFQYLQFGNSVRDISVALSEGLLG